VVAEIHQAIGGTRPILLVLNPVACLTSGVMSSKQTRLELSLPALVW
jgi:hypothetical protein